MPPLPIVYLLLVLEATTKTMFWSTLGTYDTMAACKDDAALQLHKELDQFREPGDDQTVFRDIHGLKVRYRCVAYKPIER